MNLYYLTKYLDNTNIKYYVNEIFFDNKGNEINPDYYNKGFDYYLNNYTYDYELIIDLNNIYDINKLIHKLTLINTEEMKVIIDKYELTLRNKE